MRMKQTRMMSSQVVDKNGGKGEIKSKGAQKTKNELLKRNQRGKAREKNGC